MKSSLGVTTVLAAGLVLAGCSSNEPRGHLSSVPRPELTVPPGEMSTQKLVLMKSVAASSAAKGIGSVSIAPEGNGILLRVELRGAPVGKHLLTLNENNDCGAEEIEGVKVAAAAAGKRWAPEGLKSPAIEIEVPADGYVKAEYTAANFQVSDLRGRSLVLTSGEQRIGCGVSN